MKHVVITGSNRGIGLAFCRHYLAQGFRVSAACRHPDSASDLKALSGELSVFSLDLASESSIENFASQLVDQSVDLIVNNAGVYGGTPQGLDDLSSKEWLNTLNINAVAPIFLTRSILNHIDSSQSPKVAFLTSKMGSIADNTSGRSYIYRSSKAALNAAAKSLAIDLSSHNIPVVLLHPGWVRTDMGGPNGLIDTQESVAGMAQVIDHLDMRSTGAFFDYSGKEIPW
ncbi:SDR family oxidoreductase [Pleionea litopenaei]|uniref:SDR family oxidoreductase n=1 Tax=Pleionea litopenaei TaxID=3070815 RepID=A0AA51RSY6_9GAMM|nr:SDR family oxidoreductase [Pleionea sp. HL-JVS1]WMS86923.1 SDR family oxidoreductase [Pleionea sp. HL-JVS1]